MNTPQYILVSCKRIGNPIPNEQYPEYNDGYETEDWTGVLEYTEDWAEQFDPETTQDLRLLGYLPKETCELIATGTQTATEIENLKLQFTEILKEKNGHLEFFLNELDKAKKEIAKLKSDIDRKHAVNVDLMVQLEALKKQ